MEYVLQQAIPEKDLEKVCTIDRVLVKFSSGSYDEREDSANRMEFFRQETALETNPVYRNFVAVYAVDEAGPVDCLWFAVFGLSRRAL